MLTHLPDWSGETCVIVASGPSAAALDYSQIKGRSRFIAINCSWRLAPWADAVYACDYAWWKRHHDALAGFEGLRWCADVRAEREGWGVTAVGVRMVDHLLFDERGVVGRGGGTSAFQALNLAAQMGCTTIVLAGVDCRLDRGIHWHGKHADGLNNPTALLVERWRHCIDAAAPVLAARNITVLNASADSALQNYPKITLAEVLL